MKDSTQKAIQDGKTAESFSKEMYINGENGDYTADIMREVSETGVIFGGYFNHNGRKHFPDGYIQIGRTMHIFEMKDGAPHNEAHAGQVIRYAHVMNIAMNFDTVITYIIYGSRKEVVIEEYNARDIPIVYAATRYEDDYAYSWQADKRASMTDADREIHNARDRVISAARRAKRTPEQVAIDNKKQREGSAKKRANRTPEQVTADNEKRRVYRAASKAKRTPEQVAADNEKKRINMAKYRANKKLK